MVAPASSGKEKLRWASSFRLKNKSVDSLIEPLTTLVADDMGRVNQTILARTGSDVAMIPEVANHLIRRAASGCGRC